MAKYTFVLEKMICITFIVLFSIAALPKSSDGVKVNMEGSMSFGKDVVDTLSHFMQWNSLSGRRSGATGESVDQDPDGDVISLTVNSAFLCRDIKFCQDDTRTFVNEYIITLAKAIEEIFVGLVNNMNTRIKETNMNTRIKETNEKSIVFEDELKQILQDLKKLLKSIDAKLNESNAAYAWYNFIKKITAKFQVRAVVLAGQRLEGKSKDVKNKLTHKILITTSLVELKFEGKLCSEHGICYGSFEATDALNAALERLRSIPDERTKEFIKYFSEALPATNFYYRITDVTGNEFKAILHDMAFAENILTKNVLAIVHKCVDGRLKALKSKFSDIDLENSGKDVILAHVILSDLDHFYSKQKKDPFKDFFRDFYDWSKTGGVFVTPLRRVMKDIQNMLNSKSDELVSKLINAVIVFMEITVDPDT